MYFVYLYYYRYIMRHKNVNNIYLEKKFEILQKKNI